MRRQSKAVAWCKAWANGAEPRASASVRDWMEGRGALEEWRAACAGRSSPSSDGVKRERAALRSADASSITHAVEGLKRASRRSPAARNVSSDLQNAKRTYDAPIGLLAGEKKGDEGMAITPASAAM